MNVNGGLSDKELDAFNAEVDQYIAEPGYASANGSAQLWAGWHNPGGEDLSWSSSGSMINNDCNQTFESQANNPGSFCTLSNDRRQSGRKVSQASGVFYGDCGTPARSETITVTSGGKVQEVDGTGRPCGQFERRTLKSTVTFSCGACNRPLRWFLPDDAIGGGGHGGD